MNKLFRERTLETFKISQTNQESSPRESQLHQKSLLKESLLIQRSLLRTLKCLSNNWSSHNQPNLLRITELFLNSLDNLVEWKTEILLQERLSSLRKIELETYKFLVILSLETLMFNQLFRLLMKELEFNRHLRLEELLNQLLNQLKLKITIELDLLLYLLLRSINKMLSNLFLLKKEFNYNTTTNKINM